MAAGLGFKTFTTGEVLTAGDVNGYLMQGINVFASEAARNAAITSPQEGQFAFTKDTNSLWYYTGSAWAASGATGDIEGVTAGVGISGGGTSGTVTITNSMATEIAAKGDLIAGTGSQTFDNLTVGANNTVLTADSTTATGLKWATPAASTPAFVGCRAYFTASVTLATATSTAVAWTAEDFDTDGFHSTSTNTSRFTIPSGKDGKYSITYHVLLDPGSGNQFDNMIKKNGTNAEAFYWSCAGAFSSSVTRVFSAVGGDYFELFVSQNSGSNKTLEGGTLYNSFTLTYLGA
jgi:hypothetical protein